MSATIQPESDVGGELARLAHRVSFEFGAPAGLIDASTGSWLARSGAPDEVFPGIPVQPFRMRASTTREALAERVEVWRPACDGSSGVVWLVFPVKHAGLDLVAAAGFSNPGAGPGAGASPWGPVCPEAALRAWGKDLAERLRERPGPVAQGAETGSTLSPGSARAVADGGDGVVLARLIRRFRISDPPQRFQQLSCNALRAALGVQAVAWTPCHHAEPVVSIGEVGRARGNDFRALIPVPATELVRLSNDPDDASDPEVRRVIAVSADSQGSLGWLIALNPTDGRPFTQADAELLQPVASLIATQQTNARVYGDLKELLFGVIRALTAAIDAKDPYTCGHSERVARIAVRIADELGMPAAQRSDLYLMGLLHDVGKIGVDDAVLKKPGPLTPDEYRQIQRHVEIGVQILSDLKKLNHLLPGVRHHHESLDGSGYPCGLSGDQIPYEARILAAADSYDAMSSTRPYRRRLTPSQIDEVLRKGAGLQWDPKIIDALFACRIDLEMIRQKGLGESLQIAVSGALGRNTA